MDTAAALKSLEALVFRKDAPRGAILELAPLSDTGTAVPIAVRLQAPPGLTLTSFAVFAPENPVSRIIEVRTGNLDQYLFETRVRLGASQTLWLVATLSDGTLLGATAHTVLTSSACFDGS